MPNLIRPALLIASATMAVAPAAAPAQTLLDQLIHRVAKKRAAAQPAAASATADGSTARAAGASEIVPAFLLDVAGVRLGMSADQARAALANAGYRIPAEGTRTGPGFATRVAEEAAERRTGKAALVRASSEVTTDLKGYGPHRETIDVDLAPAASGGSVVTRVHLDVPTDVMKGEAFLQQAASKYGTPDGVVDGGLTLAWCTAPLKARCGQLSPFQRAPEALPNLSASMALSANRITLSEGTDQERDRARAFAAAVERAAPKTDRAAF